MYRLHRNSQKRIYVKNGIYFITTNTHNGYPYFKNDVFCDLFVETLNFCRELKKFDIFGYKINPNHIHLLIQPLGVNFSDIIGSLKRNVSRNINCLIEGRDFVNTKGDDSNRRLLYGDGGVFVEANFQSHLDKLEKFRTEFLKNYKNYQSQFKWQKSFHFHVVNGHNDLRNHLSYIERQWIKHGLPENKHCFVAWNVLK